jgi:aryl-alcohol dehydrogenase-like predicted oxidoreductase
MDISTIGGVAASSLGLAAHPEQDPKCVQRAFEAGINLFFFYSPGQKHFVDALKPVAAQRRDEIILASGSGSRTPSGLRAVRRKILSALEIETLDIFFAEYINPGDETSAVFGRDGVLAHRKAASEVFPTALETNTPVIAFTATRWGTLLEPHPEWSERPPTAADCYRYCLAQNAVQIVLSAPKSVEELTENLSVLKLPPMNVDERNHWERFGDVIYNQGGRQNHDFESQWP